MASISAPASPLALSDVWGTAFYERAQALSGFGVWTLDLRSDQWRLSAPAANILGLDASCVADNRKHLFERLSSVDRLRVTTAWTAFLDWQVSYEIEYALQVHGKTRWVWEKAELERDANGEPRAVMGVVQDISARRSEDAALVRRANFDSLTNLPNRYQFDSHLERSMAVCRRRQERLALMLIDLDHFKEVNDLHGHQAGDLVLRSAAKRMQACLRGSDMIARLGGDEFIAVLQDIEQDSEAALIALRLIEEVSRPYVFGSARILIGASVGIAVLPEDGTDVKTLLEHADTAMYGAKHAGRTTLRFFEPDAGVQH